MRDPDRERLLNALKKSRIAVGEGCDIDAFACEVTLAFVRRSVLHACESAELAQQEAKWIERVGGLAGELAKLLRSPPGTMGAKVENHFISERFADYGLLSPLELRPMLIALKLAARNARREDVRKRRLGEAPLPKRNGRSPAAELIRKVAAAYEHHTGKKAYIGRKDAEGRKGGQFFDFVNACADEWNPCGRRKNEQPQHSAEAIAVSLRRAKRLNS